jgi:hypothetical protein
MKNENECINAQKEGNTELWNNSALSTVKHTYIHKQASKFRYKCF